jgi:alkanesulfonate monooxygenase SsuD/methylene tetrahydromethanopterin reductase-like flavin-dependent oxidoreductase (luciferase family)
MAEHHFQPEGTELIPNLLMMATHLCGVTQNIRVGCGFNIVPMWHPLRLAEDYAMADILTGGRVVFGVGRGYHTREVETFGAPLLDQVANREMFEEGVEIVFKAFEGKPFSHRGKYYTIPPEVPYRGYTLSEITLVPAPERLPVECWQPVQGGSERAFDFMARHGINGVIGGGSAEGGGRTAHDRLPGRLRSAWRPPRTGRAPRAWLPVPHIVEPRASDPRGGPVLRGRLLRGSRVVRSGPAFRAEEVWCTGTGGSS